MASFSDDFNRADSTSLGAGWVEVSGDWSIASNRLSPGAAGGTIILRAATATAGNDNFAQTTIATTTTASQGVWCRGNTTITSGYLWRNNGSSWNMFAVVGGSFIDIGSYAAAAAPGDVAKVQAVGSAIKGYVNGIERVSVVNTDVPTGTSVGLRAESVSGLRFDDFQAGDVTAGATLGTAAATDTAQPLTGTKSAALGTAAAQDAAQQLAGTKAATLGTAGATDTGQPLTGAKSAELGTAAAQDTAQTLTGGKSASLGTAGATEAAQPLPGTLTAGLGTAAATDTAQSLTGAKTAALGTAAEQDAARPLSPAGDVIDGDYTVGAPHSTWAVGEPHGSGWKVGAPW